MQTGLIKNWLGNPAEVGPVYPFVGFEVALALTCFILWILYTVWQMKFKCDNYAKEEEVLTKSRSNSSEKTTLRLV